MSESSNNLPGLWQELKNRNVLRVVTLYVAISFGFIELIDIISGPLNLPDWVITVVILLSAVGLPFAVILSWLFVLTPEGIKRYGHLVQEDSPEYSFADRIIVYESDSSEITPAVSSHKPMGKIYGFSSFLIICLVIVLFLFYSGKSTPFSERDWIVLADFTNHTEEDIFDHSLNTAFEISIDQSRHINVIPRKRAQEVLKRIGHEAGTAIDEALCREIALREGAGVYIVPEISRVGNHFVLTAKLMETENSNVVVSEILYSESRDEILEIMDRMTRKMRRHLGESRYQISSQSKPLQQVTTFSLDALKQYSLGFDSHISLDFTSAVSYYRNAIRIDSNFTAAKASLGNILYEKFDKEEGRMWLDEAMKSVDDLTEREQYSILAFYAANVEKDLEKSIEYNRMCLELYPDIATARNNLGWYLQNLGRYEESCNEYKEAIRIEPYTMLSYGGLIWNYLAYLGQLDSAKFWSHKMIGLAPESGWGYLYLGSCHFGLDEYEKAAAQFEKGRDVEPGLVINLYRLSHTYRVMGKYDNAVRVLNEIIRINPNDSSVYYDLGVSYELMGEDLKARDYYLMYKSATDFLETRFPDDPNTFLVKGMVLTKLGEKEEGFRAGMKSFEMDTSNHFDFVRFLAVQERNSEALDQLEIAFELGYRDICWLKMQSEIALLQDEPRYNQLLSKYFN